MTERAVAQVEAGIRIDPAPAGAFAEVLSPGALAFVASLHRRFQPRRQQLLARRAARQAEIDAGALPDFLPATRAIREAEWRVAPPPLDLLDRRVEITGPTDRKMIINALNSGARVFMADFEDSNSPTWHNVVQGQVNLRDAVRGAIAHVDPATGRRYRLAERTAVLMVRPRGLHLPERHLILDGEPAFASVVDFGLFLYHNAAALRARATGPYFYLPKLESHLEARLWNDIFVAAEEALDLPVGTIRATVLIETILAAFEMDEILYELRDHSAGLNCGRWDYIFSFIKKLRNRPELVLPDRAQVTMDRPFLRSYVDLLIRTCHRRGAHAMGGMAAQIPIRDDPEANARALARVRDDKVREANAGHDGTWIAHPGLASTALAAFDAVLHGPNQFDRLREEVRVTARDLLEVPSGTITEAGFLHNLKVGIQYLEAWLGGNGCVPLYHLMEDAATAEICRAQVWQWIRHRARSDDGAAIDEARFEALVPEALRQIRGEIGEPRFEAGRFGLAVRLFTEMTRDERFEEFLTLRAYEHLAAVDPAA
jgi:malate synthase